MPSCSGSGPRRCAASCAAALLLPNRTAFRMDTKLVSAWRHTLLSTTHWQQAGSKGRAGQATVGRRPGTEEGRMRQRHERRGAAELAGGRRGKARQAVHACAKCPAGVGRPQVHRSAAAHLQAAAVPCRALEGEAAVQESAGLRRAGLVPRDNGWQPAGGSARMELRWPGWLGARCAGHTPPSRNTFKQTAELPQSSGPEIALHPELRLCPSSLPASMPAPVPLHA